MKNHNVKSYANNGKLSLRVIEKTIIAHIEAKNWKMADIANIEYIARNNQIHKENADFALKNDRIIKSGIAKNK